MNAILLITMTSLLACGDKSSTLEDGDINIGEDLYTADCSGCHSADGTGGAGPNILNKSDSAITTAIIEGKGSMPAFSAYTDQDIADIISYIGTL